MLIRGIGYPISKDFVSFLCNMYAQVGNEMSFSNIFSIKKTIEIISDNAIIIHI